MQYVFSLTDQSVNDVLNTLSKPRTSKYFVASAGDKRRALDIYYWNTALSQCLYYPLQAFEVAYRNSCGSYLAVRYGANWPHERAFRDQLVRPDLHLLLDAIDRQIAKRRIAKPATDPIIADLSLGFWSSLLTRKYQVPLTLTKGISQIFPHLPAGKTWQEAGALVTQARELRNKVAHHEPIFHLANLPKQVDEVIETIGWLCKTTGWLMKQRCEFHHIWNSKP